jgi:hypothetical protein
MHAYRRAREKNLLAKVSGPYIWDTITHETSSKFIRIETAMHMAYSFDQSAAATQQAMQL